MLSADSIVTLAVNFSVLLSPDAAGILFIFRRTFCGVSVILIGADIMNAVR